MMHRIPALLSFLGFAASIIAYVESFSGSSSESVFRWWIVLIPGMIGLFIPLYVREYPSSRAPLFFLTGFAREMPEWVAPCAKALAVIGLIHLIWFAAHSGLGAPSIEDGQYVLSSRSHVLKVLSRAEYMALRGDELRAFASMTAAFYFVPMMYWWFRR